MNTVHNVTVASPPSVRREMPMPVPNYASDIVEPLDRRRTRTRTLEPDEIIILKHRTPDKETESLSATTAVEVKDPVAFEIKFEEAKPKSTITKRSTDIVANDDDYADDFDSYESDFESGSSSAASLQSVATGQSLSVSQSNSKSTSTESINQGDPSSISDVKSRKPYEDERQLDSGAFELKTQVERSLMNSIDEREPQSDEQNDSGIGYNSVSVTPKAIAALVVDDESHRPTQSVGAIHRNETMTNKRGRELMQKLALDTMTYSIFEIKPIPYEYYMKVYGHVNSTQMATQTNENHSDQDAQTDMRPMQNVWTQWPPRFSSKDALSASFHQDRIGYGMEDGDVCFAENQCKSLYDESLHKMARLKSDRALATMAVRPATIIDYNRLSLFLQKCAITVSGLVAEHDQRSHQQHRSWISCADGYFALDSFTMPNIRMLYANGMCKNFLYTVHEEQTSHVGGTPKISIFVWNLVAPAKPVSRLSGWGRICCLEISWNVSDVVVAGLDDGSLAVWHMSESAMTEDDGTPTFAPSQVIMPSTENKCVDYGRAVAIKCLNVSGTTNSREQCQVCKIC